MQRDDRCVEEGCASGPINISVRRLVSPFAGCFPVAYGRIAATGADSGCRAPEKVRLTRRPTAAGTWTRRPCPRLENNGAPARRFKVRALSLERGGHHFRQLSLVSHQSHQPTNRVHKDKRWQPPRIPAKRPLYKRLCEWLVDRDRRAQFRFTTCVGLACTLAHRSSNYRSCSSSVQTLSVSPLDLRLFGLSCRECWLV